MPESQDTPDEIVTRREEQARDVRLMEEGDVQWAPRRIPLVITPTKSVGEMDDAELDVWATKVVNGIAAQRDRPKAATGA